MKLRRLHGTERDARNLNEPKARAGEPTMPRRLSPTARAEWRRLVAILAEMRVLTVADGPALELLVVALAEHHELQRVLAATGRTYESKNEKTGVTMQRVRPEVAQAADAWRRASALLARFGLTPADRTRVEAERLPTVGPEVDAETNRLFGSQAVGAP